MITVLDVICLLWTYHISGTPQKRTTFQDQTAYLMKMLKLHGFEDGDKCVGPSYHILTKPMKALIYENNNLAAESRVKMILALQWCLSNVVLTKKESKRCSQPWDNCPELLSWKAPHRQKKPQRHHVVFILSENQIIRQDGDVSCVMCQREYNKSQGYRNNHPILAEKVKSEPNCHLLDLNSSKI
ncbi:8618_t:CDS:2 [Ambispora leptoticha]|uniref:8618_t:CDS:1 n=1 Tax=Ambispora leptoticha TaxID=144679 RepID=A0A9N9FU41_9GLOM|nr:8618_t:CDS:2 [Ambispora leptoticha]